MNSKSQKINNKKSLNKIGYLLIFLLIVWLGLSITRLIYNIGRSVTEEKKWFMLSDHQKKDEIYGDVNYVVKFLDTHFPQKKVHLIITSDAKHFFIARYSIYPRLIFWDKLEKDIYNSTHKYEVIINFHPEENLKTYNDASIEKIAGNRKLYKVIKDNKVIAEIYI